LVQIPYKPDGRRKNFSMKNRVIEMILSERDFYVLTSEAIDVMAF
jgi:hypothetical protein